MRLILVRLCFPRSSPPVACLFGVLLPTLVRAFKADPRTAAGLPVLASTDLTTLMAYLWLGAVFLVR